MRVKITKVAEPIVSMEIDHARISSEILDQLLDSRYNIYKVYRYKFAQKINISDRYKNLAVKEYDNLLIYLAENYENIFELFKNDIREYFSQEIHYVDSLYRLFMENINIGDMDEKEVKEKLGIRLYDEDLEFKTQSDLSPFVAKVESEISDRLFKTLLLKLLRIMPYYINKLYQYKAPNFTLENNIDFLPIVNDIMNPVKMEYYGFSNQRRRFLYNLLDSTIVTVALNYIDMVPYQEGCNDIILDIMKQFVIILDKDFEKMSSFMPIYFNYNSRFKAILGLKSVFYNYSFLENDWVSIGEDIPS